MRTVGTAMVSSIGILVALWCSASAYCDLRQYDSTAPAAVRGVVSNQFADFEWASDVDNISGRLWVWHYILNNRKDRGLGALWEKAGIRIPLVRPLPPGQAFCNKFLADSVRPNPDTDARIIYGTNSQEQQAAVYVADKPPKLSATSAKISSSYSDEDGKPVSVDIEVSTAQTSKGLFLALQHSPGLVIGLSSLSVALSKDQLEAISSSAREQDASVALATYSQYTKQDPAKALANLYQPQDRPDDKTNFLFFSGSSTKLEISAGAVEKASADMIVLDQKTLRPVLATDVALLVPTKK